MKDIFQSIAAKSGTEPCCDWVGEEGAGHFVKMVRTDDFDKSNPTFYRLDIT